MFTFEIYFLLAAVLIVPSSALREISSLLDEAEGLTNTEISALRPLFEELQLQYDFVVSQAPEKVLLTDEQFEHHYELSLKEFEQQLDNILPQKEITTYNTSLPTFEEIIGRPDLSSMATEQRLEFLDLQNIFQEALDDSQTNLNKLVALAIKLEKGLVELSKPKIVTLIYKALQKGYQVAGRIGRAAYCTYSHLPQLNASLNSLYEGRNCYIYTTSLILKIQKETYQTIKTVRKTIFELASVYNKLTAQNTLMGKIVTVIMNITKIARNIFETIQTARHVLDGIENQLPAATQEVISCGSNVAPQIPIVFETVSDVTECIVFKDETVISYDFLKSEEEYNKYIHTDLPDLVENEVDEKVEEDSK